jgi:undecaprenyl-diphosphatase
MLEQLEILDKELFLFLNSTHSDVMDVIMWHISGKPQWIPFYIILLYFTIKKYKKQSYAVIPIIALLIFLSDQTSVHFFKEVFERYRPCHNLELKEMVHLVNNKCGGKYSFVSSHATNSFAVAVFVSLLLKRRWFLILLPWAAVVSYSRIYLGVHYPLDVLGGAILGSSIALALYFSVNKTFLKNA